MSRKLKEKGKVRAEWNDWGRRRWDQGQEVLNVGELERVWVELPGDQGDGFVDAVNLMSLHKHESQHVLP